MYVCVHVCVWCVCVACVCVCVVCVCVCMCVCMCVCVRVCVGGGRGDRQDLTLAILPLHPPPPPPPFSLTCASYASRCSGELQQNALHLAAHANNLPLLEELLRFAEDVEVRNASYLQPLALTTPSNHCHCVWWCRAGMYVTAVEQMLRQLGEREGERYQQSHAPLHLACTTRNL